MTPETLPTPQQSLSPYQRGALMMAAMGLGLTNLQPFLNLNLGLGWILCALLAIPWTLGWAWLISRLNRRFPGQSLPGYALRLLGGFGGRALTLVYALWFLLVAAFTLRFFLDGVHQYLFPRSPMGILTVSMLAASLLLACCPLRGIARVFEVLLYLCGAAGLLLCLPAFGSLVPERLLGLGQLSAEEWAESARQMPLMTLGAECLLFVSAPLAARTARGPQEQQPLRDRGALHGCLAATLTRLFFLTLLVATLSCAALYRSNYPLLTLGRHLQPAYGLAGRMDLLCVLLWQVLGFMTLSLYQHLAGEAIAVSCGLRPGWPAQLLLLPLLYLLAMLPPDQAEVTQLWHGLMPWGVPLMTLVPLGLMILALGKRGRRA